MPFAQRFKVVIDCPDPEALAGFYQGLLGGTVRVTDEDWVVLSDTGGVTTLNFQQVKDHQPPTWPVGERPQQFHIDIHVAEADLDAADAAVLALGAVRHEVQPGEAAGDSFRVYLDPAGHPFCLCW